MQLDIEQSVYRGKRRTRQLNAFERDEHIERQQPAREQGPQQIIDYHRQILEDLHNWKDLHCQLSTNNLDGIQLASSNEELLPMLLEAAEIDLCSNNETFPFQQPMEGADGWEVLCCDVPQQPGRLLQSLGTTAPTIAPTTGPDVITQAPTIKYDPTSPDQIDFFPFVVGQCFVSGVAAFFSLATILAMILPLFKKRRRKRASTYNLYLVFLAIPDLMYNLFLTYLFGTYNRVMQGIDESGNIRNYKWVAVLNVGEVPWIDHPFDLALFATCAAANLYMNAIIALEIIKLLRNSKRRMRSQAPTLQKACIQAISTYTIGAIIFMVDYFNDNLKDRLPTWLVTLLYLPIAILIPIFILLWVCFRIYWERLIGDTRTKAGKRLTILIRYFTRIIVVYICIWLPAVIFYTAQFFDERKEGLYYFIACILYSLSAWANFGLSLTKPDVRKNFRDLFTGKVFLPEKKIEKEAKKVMNIGNNDEQPAKVTTNTDEEELGDKFPIENEAIADLEHGAIENNGVGSLMQKQSSNASRGGNDANVFDFGGADAPVMRLPTEKSRWSIMMPGMAIPHFSNPKRNTTGSAGATPNGRSSLFADQSRRGSAYESQSSEWASDSYSEPFQIHTSGRRDSFFGRSDLFGGTNESSAGNAFSESNKYAPEELEKQHEASQRSVTTAFFMDQSLASRSVVTKFPKTHKKWSMGLKKNIRDMARLLKSPGVSEDQRTVYQHSIQLKRRALQSIMLLDNSDHRSGASIAVGGVDVSPMSEMSTGTFQHSSENDSDSDVEDNDIFGNVHNNIVEVTRYSKVRWLSELNKNIHDLSVRLEEEGIGEEERALISRAIESQKVTLASIESFSEDVDGSASSVSHRNVDNVRNSAYVTSNLAVIDDESESGSSSF